MKVVMTIIYLILVILGITFAALNASSVHVNFYVKAIDLPVSVLIICVLGIGVLLGFLLFFCRYLRLRAEHHHLKHQLQLTEKEIKNLRAIPLRNEH